MLADDNKGDDHIRAIWNTSPCMYLVYVYKNTNKISAVRFLLPLSVPTKQLYWLYSTLLFEPQPLNISMKIYTVGLSGQGSLPSSLIPHPSTEHLDAVHEMIHLAGASILDSKSVDLLCVWVGLIGYMV